MDPRPSYPPYAVKDLSQLAVELPKNSIKPWRSLGRIPVLEAKAMKKDIISFLQRYSSLRHRTDRIPSSVERERVAVLFVGDDEHSFCKSEAFKALKQSVQDSGILFVDTEFASRKTLEQFGCGQQAASGTIDLVQLGSLSGHAALIQVNYDCREAHKCVCDEDCPMGKCILNNLQHKPWEYQESSKNYGVSVPSEVVGWLTDEGIIKVQSQIVATEGSYGDIDRLELLLGVRIPSFVELQNLTVAWYPQRELVCRQSGCSDREFYSRHLFNQHVDERHGGVVPKKSGNNFLAKMLGVVPADEHYKKMMGRPVWDVERRKKFSLWTSALRYYDISDVLVPAAFLLQIGVDIVEKERVTCSTTNVIPYLRQMLLLYKNEPSLVGKRNGAPLEKICPFLDWSGFSYRNIRKSECGSFPWRPGMELPSGLSVRGPIIARNLRQLAMEIMVDVYTLGLDLEDLREDYRPPWINSDRLSVAKRVWNYKPKNEAPRKVRVHQENVNRRFGYLEERSRKRKAEDFPLETDKRARMKPNHKQTRPVYFGRCFVCGSTHHNKDGCKSREVCRYPLCSHAQRRHSTIVCDALHAICGVCRFRGHVPKDHNHFDLVSLIKIAIAWAPEGLFTSLPILSGDPAFWRQPDNEEVSYDVFNRTERFKFYEKNQMKETE